MAEELAREQRVREEMEGPIISPEEHAMVPPADQRRESKAKSLP